MRFVFSDILENPDHIRLWLSLVKVSAKVMAGTMNNSRICFADRNLSLPVKRRTKIKYRTGVTMPPKYYNFDQKIFSVTSKGSGLEYDPKCTNAGCNHQKGQFACTFYRSSLPGKKSN